MSHDEEIGVRKSVYGPTLSCQKNLKKLDRLDRTIKAGPAPESMYQVFQG
jgi:hypothetical protein